MNFKHKQIIKVFEEDIEKVLFDGVWFSEIEGVGEFKSWYNDGRLSVHCFYNDEGNLEGEFKSWYHNGQLAIHCFYNGTSDEPEKGLKGEYKRWWDNGQLYIHRFYNDKGVKEGEYKKWNPSGRLIVHKLYRNNRVIKDYLE